MAQVKKLSVGAVFGKIKPEHYLTTRDGKPVPKDRPTPIVRFGGTCVASKIVPVAAYPDKPATAFMGDFVAVNHESGEVSKASVMYLPDVLATWLLVQLARPETKAVQFLADVSVVASDNTRPGAMPYMYAFEHVLPPDESDPITKLLAAGQAHSPVATLALAAPASSAPAVAQVPAPEPAPPVAQAPAPKVAAPGAAAKGKK